MLEARNLSLDYVLGKKRKAELIPAFRALNMALPSGSISSVLGPSGCGKTSILNVIAGLVRPSSGSLLLDGAELSGLRPKTAVIFQHYGLLPWRNVEANAELGLLIQRLPAAERKKKIHPILEELGLMDFRRFYPDSLSGGMRQRVAIARALAMEPDLLLMDEPFSSLDALGREAAQDFLLELRKKRPMTILLVSHSIEEAVYLSERVYVMAGRNPGFIADSFDIEPNRAEKRFGNASYSADYQNMRDSKELPVYAKAIRASINRFMSEEKEAVPGQGGLA